IPQLLLRLNDILSLGFDAHHFIAGLASHFRDLMVCKNSETISLLEVGEQTKKKYHEQAQKSTMAFLLKALEMANDCDLKYRTSRNPRLLVELCLMQLASITFDGEKKKDERYIIAPIHFAENPVGTHNSIKKQDGLNTEDQESVSSPVSNIASESSEKISQNTTEIEQNQLENAENKPKVTTPIASVSGFSLKGMQRKKEILERQNSKHADETKLPRETFTEIAMQAVWKEYIARLRKTGEKLMASTLETDLPKLNGTTIHLEFPNDTMRVELERAQHNLLEYLKRKLNNYDIDLSITVNEKSAKKFAFTPREKYEKMLETNPNLELLLKTFDLDL
ncbi:MAG: DNA polymerase III subunit gamma/tau, partial [Leeuwenhoekiella sp.]